MKKELIEKIANYIATPQKHIIVNDFASSEDPEIYIQGFKYIPVIDGNILKSVLSDEIYDPQYASVRRGNNCELRLLSSSNETLHIDEIINLKNICDKDVVIVTRGKFLVAIAPVYISKLELTVFLNTIKEWCGNDFCKKNAFHESILLAKFLFRNNPNRIYF